VLPLVLCLLTLLGVLLMIAGVRLIGLVAAFTGGTLGGCVAVTVQGSIAPDWSPALCAASATVIGTALGALFVRPAVATGFAIVGATLGIVVAAALIERGITSPPPSPDGPQAAGEIDTASSQSVRETQTGIVELVRRIALESREVQASDDAMRALAGIGRRSWISLTALWQRVPSASRTLLLALGAGGAALGIGLVIAFPRWSVAGASSALGAALALSCGLPLGERLTGAFRTPQSPVAWFMLFAALTLAGWAFQMRRVQSRREEPAPSRE
jgi:hypothetical protein